MFDNPGKSLKKLGGAIWGIGGILSLIGGMWMFGLASQASRSYYSDSAGGFVFGGIIIIVLGIFVSYLMSIFIALSHTKIRGFFMPLNVYSINVLLRVCFHLAVMTWATSMHLLP